jgi:hypothetical protein
MIVTRGSGSSTPAQAAATCRATSALTRSSRLTRCGLQGGSTACEGTPVRAAAPRQRVLCRCRRGRNCGLLAVSLVHANSSCCSSKQRPPPLLAPPPRHLTA